MATSGRWKYSIFMSKMPSKAKPRIISSKCMRSCGAVGVAPLNATGLLADEVMEGLQFLLLFFDRVSLDLFFPSSKSLDVTKRVVRAYMRDRVGGGLTASVLSHHRAYGSVPRRFIGYI